jgi:hypothetical protein
VASVLYALLFLPALLAVALVVVRRPKTLAEAVVENQNPFSELDAVLAELESATLDERNAGELEALAERLERIA